MTTLVDKLRAMAAADESPYEAAIAREKLATMGAGGRIPPQRPPAAPAPMPESWPRGWPGFVVVRISNGFTTTTNSNTGSATWTVSL